MESFPIRSERWGEGSPNAVKVSDPSRNLSDVDWFIGFPSQQTDRSLAQPARKAVRPERKAMRIGAKLTRIQRVVSPGVEPHERMLRRGPSFNTRRA